MRFITSLEKSKNFWFLILISIVFFLLRLPSLYEPYWYGDEGVYQAVGILINNGERLYSGAWENKPPFLPALYAIFNSDQFLLRGVSLISGLMSVWFFFLTSKALFPLSKYAPIFATSAFAPIFGTRLIEGNIANAENFMILPITLASYLIISTDSWKKLYQSKSYFLAGMILSIAFLTKIVAIFDFFAFFLFLLVAKEHKFNTKIKERIIPFALGFSVLPLATASYFLTTNNFKGFLDALLIQNVGYVGYGNYFIISQGLLFLKIIFLLLSVGAIYLLRKKLGRSFIFITIWFAFSLFNAFFSQRPYTHYLITLLPSFSLLIGLIVYEKRTRIVTLGIFVISYLIINSVFNLKFEFTKYYSNFISFFTYKISIQQYQSFFDINTPRDYEIARYIKINTSKDDEIFIWGNNAHIYKLADKTPLLRYTVAYHITNFPGAISEMEKAIRAKNPKLIIVMSDVPEIPLDLTNYSEKMIINDAIIYERLL